MRNLVLFIVLLLLSSAVLASDLSTADSLFAEKKYTESFEIYKKLHEENRVASPAMLLKMAYIKEGLGGYSDALYYLNLYYLKTADKKVLNKMESLAEKKDLIGYSNNDFEFIQTVFYNYFNLIVLFTVSAAILFLTLSYYLKFKKSGSPAIPLVFMVIMLGLAFYIINFGKSYNRAIVNQTNTYLMSGPSAASEVLKIIGKGNRVSTISQTDVWTKVNVGSTTGYIKTSKLKEVSL